MSPKTRWVIAIVALLGGNALAMSFLLTTANTGSSRVIPAYYDRAVHYDDAIDEARAGRALGWVATPMIDRGSIEVRVGDRDGAPLTAARVRVSGRPRARATHSLAVELTEIRAGAYRSAAAIEAGWQDLAITVERGGHKLVRHVAVEIR